MNNQTLRLVLLSLSLMLLCTPLVLQAQWEPDRRLTFDPRSSFSYGRCLTASGQNLHLVWTDLMDGRHTICHMRLEEKEWKKLRNAKC